MCIHKTDAGACAKYSDRHVVSYCVEGPCPDDTPTHGDRIRAMPDEEMAEFLILSPEMEFDVCRYCKYGNTVPDDRGQCLAPRGHCIAQDRCDAFKIWLRQPAPREEGGS